MSTGQRKQDWPSLLLPSNQKSTCVARWRVNSAPVTRIWQLHKTKFVGKMASCLKSCFVEASRHRLFITLHLTLPHWWAFLWTRCLRSKQTVLIYKPTWIQTRHTKDLRRLSWCKYTCGVQECLDVDVTLRQGYEPIAHESSSLSSEQEFCCYVERYNAQDTTQQNQRRRIDGPTELPVVTISSF